MKITRNGVTVVVKNTNIYNPEFSFIDEDDEIYKFISQDGSKASYALNKFLKGMPNDKKTTDD
uniref:Uncharacterized protein n=1 Tax=viral metagenome TaxID=1070528 RepID=A0A6M3M217_9ZZZZ